MGYVVAFANIFTINQIYLEENRENLLFTYFVYLFRQSPAKVILLKELRL
jgi:hypothetical protein